MMNKNPIIPFLLIIFLGIGLVFLLSGLGATDDGEEDVATEEGSEESGGGEEASSGDVDAGRDGRLRCSFVTV